MKKSWNNMRKWICLLGLASLTGCTDGLLYKMKAANPYFRREWEKDREFGVTFYERIDEIKLLQRRLASMDQSEKENWAKVLEQIVKGDGNVPKDPSPELRSLAVNALAQIPCETTVRALNSASTDESEKVRLTACESWQTIKGKAAQEMLITLARNPKESPSVRRAATHALGEFDDADVKSTLASLLDDKSPALQYQAAMSLKKLTGRDYGGDIDAWRDYMQGKDVPEPEKSLMATLWEKL